MLGSMVARPTEEPLRDGEVGNGESGAAGCRKTQRA